MITLESQHFQGHPLHFVHQCVETAECVCTQSDSTARRGCCYGTLSRFFQCPLPGFKFLHPLPLLPQSQATARLQSVQDLCSITFQPCLTRLSWHWRAKIPDKGKRRYPFPRREPWVKAATTKVSGNPHKAAFPWPHFRRLSRSH